MRKAAGILMIIVGALVGVYVGGIVSMYGFFYIPLFLSLIISAVLLVIGGVFCLKRRYWKLCFTSALLPVVIMFSWVCWTRFTPYLAWFWFLIPMGIIAIIFVYLRKREW